MNLVYDFLIALPFLYFGLLAIAFGNWMLMKRPRGKDRPCFEVMIPARDEEANIAKVNGEADALASKLNDLGII